MSVLCIKIYWSTLAYVKVAVFEPIRILYKHQQLSEIIAIKNSNKFRQSAWYPHEKPNIKRRSKQNIIYKKKKNIYFYIFTVTLVRLNLASGAPEEF